MTKRVLIIGKSPVVLSSAESLLRERGYEVATTDNFEAISVRFDLRQFDLITTGGQVPVDKRAEIRHAATAIKSDMLFVQGLAGIPGLIVEQIEGEFAAQYRTQHVPIYDKATREIQLFLEEPADVKVTCWWMTSFVPPNPGSQSQVLIEAALPTGERILSLPTTIPAEGAFASIHIGKATYCFDLTE